MTDDIFILGYARTAIGTFGNSLSDISPIALGTAVSREAISRTSIEPEAISQVVFGHVINTEPKDMYLSRVSSIDSGIPKETPSMNVNRLCGSGAQAIVSIFQSLKMGDAEFGLAGGAENMSRSPHIFQSPRWGQKMGDTKVTDMMIGALNCPFGTGHMGVTAENISRELAISRQEQDEFAAESQKRALNAIKNNYFTDQIVPVEISKKRQLKKFDTDEHPKATTIKNLSELKPIFVSNGTVTAGNSSGINDGAAAIVLGTSKGVSDRNLKPVAKILGYTQTGVRPEVMGLGPVPAVDKLCKNLKLRISDFDVIESNEAFAAQACAVNKELGLNAAKVNPNGGAIALGHPIGATGVILMIKAIAELHRTKKQLGLVTMCIGGGQGIAIAIEAT